MSRRSSGRRTSHWEDRLSLTLTLKALSTIRRHGVRTLLMGGQACVFYGGAEFSRDCDLALHADDETMSRLTAALEDLDAERIAVPPFDPAHLEAGLAIHFRCRRPDVNGLRIDVMSRLRGVDPFEELWERRTTIETEGVLVDLLSLPDLVRAKKTQRDKDWPMIARLVEADYRSHVEDPTPGRTTFWLREARTPELLTELVRRFPERTAELAADRSLLTSAVAEDEAALRVALRDEEEAEKAADREYWRPLREMLERLRRERPRAD